jgi:hypothetical protein
MKNVVAIVFLLALLGCAQRPTLSALSIREIEQLPYDEAYRLWRQEKTSLAGRHSRDGGYSIPSGGTDLKTGMFTPSRIAAVECRLGREAHLHERLLRDQLAKDADVHRILEASPRLCEKCGITSMAQVVLLPNGRYSLRSRDGWIPQAQQRLWLEVLNRTSPQQKD